MTNQASITPVCAGLLFGLELVVLKVRVRMSMYMYMRLQLQFAIEEFGHVTATYVTVFSILRSPTWKCSSKIAYLCLWWVASVVREFLGPLTVGWMSAHGLVPWGSIRRL